MATDPAPRPVTVRGGSHGMEVTEDQLVALAGKYGRVGQDMVSTSVGLHRYLVDPDLTVGALLDPTGYGAFDAGLLAALDGPFGLTWAAARCGMADHLLRGAAASYSSVETAVELLENNVELPLALSYLTAEEARTGNPSLALQRTITAYPGVADALIDDLDLPDDIKLKAEALPDGHGVAVRTGTDDLGADAAPPRQLSDIVASLGQRDDDAHHGAIDVRFLTRPDGSRAVIVDISGTKSWTPRRTSDITSLVTNGRAMVGDRTSYENGVLAAMKDAGVRSTDDVMIVGHSQGGMVAVTTARDAVTSGRYNVTHVITAGSPIGLTVGAMPRGVRVLALENERDLVPHLDGTSNPDRRDITTVTGDRGDGTIRDDHGTADGYVPIARDAQASSDPSIRDYLDSAGGYLDATHVHTKTYQIVRHY